MASLRGLTLPLALLPALLSVPPVADQAGGTAQLYVSEVAIGRQQPVGPSPTNVNEPCADGAYNLTGGRWARTLKWSFRASSTPAGLVRSDALRAIKRGYGNIVNARNDCAKPDRVGATASYLGGTSARPSCTTRDRKNVVGFRSLPSEVLARTCWWVSSGRIIEADIQINSGFSWATSLASCSFQPMLEAVMTHEVGHAFGLGHVGEKKHGRLTMSTRLDGDCNNAEATLGLGDLRALQQLY